MKITLESKKYPGLITLTVEGAANLTHESGEQVSLLNERGVCVAGIEVGDEYQVSKIE